MALFSLLCFLAAVVAFGVAAVGGLQQFIPWGLLLFAAGHITIPPRN